MVSLILMSRTGETILIIKDASLQNIMLCSGFGPLLKALINKNLPIFYTFALALQELQSKASKGCKATEEM